MAKKITQIALPHGYEPRFYQRPLFDYLLKGGTRAYWCVHRRAGKDLTCWNACIVMAHMRIGSYFYFFPTYSQGKKAVWDAIDGSGRSFLSYIPKELIASKNGTEMKVCLTNGSIIQIVGTDNFDSIMGTNPVGCVFSEYSLQDPKAWDYIRPILVENGGWAVFNGTPRGMNHFFEMYRQALENPAWFCSKMSIDETGVLTAEQIEEERRSGMPEPMIQQEYYVSFHASDELVLIPLELIEQAIGRNVSYTYAPIIAGLDLGYSLTGDPTALVIRQGGRILHIDECRKDDYREIAGWASARMTEYNCRNVAIDAIGWGAGVKQPLEDLGYEVVAVNVAETAPTKERFSRWRDELWFKCREWFEAKANCIPENLPLKGKLISELSGVTYEMLSATNKIKVQSKRDMRADGKASPNIADALCLTFAMPDMVALNHYGIETRPSFIAC